jgi:hypothetical protein
MIHLLKGTEWEMLLDFISPVFFEVVPTLGMLSVFGTVVKDYANKEKFSKIKAETESLIKESGFKFTESSHFKTLSIEDWSEEKKIEFGERVLSLYFSQFLKRSEAILDLRFSSFGENNEWSPKPIYYHWNKDFLEGIRALYLGFYSEDNNLMKKGLEKLNLAHAEDIFKNHFGEGDQDSVLFTLSHFKKSLHALFVSCKKHKAKIPPDFFTFGFYLLCLYENLEKLNVKLNVRKVFNHVAFSPTSQV